MAEEDLTGPFDGEFEEGGVEDETEVVVPLATEELATTYKSHVDDFEQMIGRQTRPLTRRYLTKYEKARLLGYRARQIEEMAPVFVPVGNERDPLKMARMELAANVCPLAIRRPLPGRDLHNSAYEIVAVNQLKGREGI